MADALMVKEQTKTPVHPPILPAVSPDEIIELLKVQKNKAEELLKSEFLTLGDVQYWNLFTKEILTKAFGPKPEYIDSIIYAVEQKRYSMYEPESTLEKQRRANFQATMKILESCLEQLSQGSSESETTGKDEGPEPPESQNSLLGHVADEGKKDLAIDLNEETTETEISQKAETMKKSGSRKVFIIHGQDEEKKLAVANFLKQLDLEPAIPHEQPGQGVNLIEDFEQNPDVVFAITLLTADDYGYPQGKPEESKPRSQQNVIFELGFLIGRLKQNLVCALYEEGLDLPSDYHGSVFIPFDEGGLWKLLVARTMKMADVEVDLNKAI